MLYTVFLVLEQLLVEVGILKGFIEGFFAVEGKCLFHLLWYAFDKKT